MILIQEALLSCFAIDEIVTIEPVQAGPLSRVWLATVKIGGELKRLSVKRHRNQAGAGRHFELELTHCLSQSGFKLIPSLVLTRDGSIYLDVDDDTYSVQEWVDADITVDWLGNTTSTIEHCFAGGGALAQFHAASARIAPTLPPGWQAHAEPFLFQLPLKVIRSLVCAQQELPPTDPARMLVIRLRERILANLEMWMEQAKKHIGEAALIHGDYHPRNVLFKGNRPAAILDLEFAHIDPRIYDVGYGAYVFAVTRQESRDCDYLDHQKVDAFRAGYNEQAFKLGLSNNERVIAQNALQPFVRLSAHVNAFWLLDQYVQEPASRHLIAPRLLNVIGDASFDVESCSSKLYI